MIFEVGAWGLAPRRTDWKSDAKCFRIGYNLVERPASDVSSVTLCLFCTALQFFTDCRCACVLQLFDLQSLQLVALQLFQRMLLNIAKRYLERVFKLCFCCGTTFF